MTSIPIPVEQIAEVLDLSLPELANLFEFALTQFELAGTSVEYQFGGDAWLHDVERYMRFAKAIEAIRADGPRRRELGRMSDHMTGPDREALPKERGEGASDLICPNVVRAVVSTLRPWGLSKHADDMPARSGFSVFSRGGCGG